MSKTFRDAWVRGYQYLMETQRQENQKEMAQNIGLKGDQHLSDVKREKAEPGHAFMEAVSHYFDLNIEQVAALGRKLLEGEPVSLADIQRHGSFMDNFALVPMTRAKPQGGTSSLETDDSVERHYAFREDFLTRKGTVDSMVLFKVGGDSMYPMVADGDTVLVDKNQTHLHDGKMYLVRIDDDIVVKWVLRKPGTIVLRSENSKWSDIELSKDDESINFEVIGKVIWIGKEIT